MPYINQMEPLFGDEERIALNNYMLEGGWITEFRKTSEFEKAIAGFCNAKHCFVVNNGTVSLTIAALAIGIKPGDDVIIPNYTMIASPNSIQILGANPVFVDVEPETLCLDIDQLKKSISSKTKAIMLVLANGRYPKKNYKAIFEFAAEHELQVIEDSAQSLGSFYPDGLHQGLMGTVGSFSFSAPKIISTGQGGALVTNDSEVAARIKKLKDFGRTGGGNDIHDSIGYNFKFTELQAVIGIEQMKKLPARISRKKEIYTQYVQRLSGCDSIQFFEQDLEHTVPWFIDVCADDRDALKQFLHEKGIGSRNMYPPIHQQEAYNRPGNYPVSELIGTKGLWLPSHSHLDDAQIDFICDYIVEFYR